MSHPTAPRPTLTASTASAVAPPDGATPGTAAPELQPLLHDLLVTLQAPTQVWGGRDGQVRAVGAQGAYHADVRTLSLAELRIDGQLPEPLAAGPAGRGRLRATSLLRGIDGAGADPTATVRREREVAPGVVREELHLECATAAPVGGRLTLRLASDLAPMEEIKQGRRRALLAPERTADGVRWSDGATVVDAVAPGATVEVDDEGATLAWDVTVSPGRPTVLRWALRAQVEGAVVGAPASAEPEWGTVRATADDSRLAPLVARSLEDLASLRMSSRLAPDETFLAAGAPWFFTLFGRDSIWAARMLLPLGTRLALGTLRTLAAGQGAVVDTATAQQPGKILHEVRSKALQVDARTTLPPVYFGTVDATSLWVCLLHDAWRWGLADAEVEPLLPALERALAWMRDHGDGDGDGFLDYADASGHGLSNQGWKDSGDSIQWRDGTLAEGPIALSEVQAYAYEAAVGGAAVLDAFGRPGADEWRAWAAGLRARFRERFWLSDEAGPYPAIALDAHGRAVDSVASNMGHLLGTGLLDADEEAHVAARLVGADMSSGFGLRTLSSSSGGYWPLRYHGGAVWAHDTAIAALGLARAGHAAEAGVLAQGLLAAGAAVDNQLPELFGGTTPEAGMLPYPAACHPQAWSAAASVALVTALLGLAPERDAGVERLVVRPATPSPVGALCVEGLRVGERRFAVAVSAAGDVEVTALD
jgi:glycogen debranching enzyme